MKYKPSGSTAKSALSASLIFAVVYFILEVLLYFGDRAFYNLDLIKYYHEFFIAVYLVPPVVLGFLSAYFFRRNKGEPLLANFHDIGLLAVLFSFLLLSLPEAFFANYFTYDWGFMGNVYGDNVSPLEVGAVIFYAIILYFIKISISIIPCFLGVLIGALVFNRPLRIENLEKRVLSPYMLITVILLLLLSLMIFAILTPPQGYDGVPPDWNKMQPLVPTITYSGSAANFTASFNNVGGTSAKLTRILVNETYSNTSCNNVMVGTVTLSSGTGNVTVAPGSAFKLDASGCNVKARGDQYLMTITVNYTTVVSGVISAHTETGTIRGNAE